MKLKSSSNSVKRNMVNATPGFLQLKNKMRLKNEAQEFKQ